MAGQCFVRTFSMEENYVQYSKVMSALSAPVRLKILDILSCGEICASAIQEYLSITQLTLS